MRTLLFTCCLFWWSNCLIAQNERYLDSIETELSRGVANDSLRFLSLSRLWRHTLNSDLPRSEAYARRVLREARSLGDPEYIALGHRFLGINLDYAGRADSSFYHYNRGISMYRAAGNRLQEGVLLFNVANQLNALGFPDSALTYLTAADSAFTGVEHWDVHSAVNHLASSIERDQGRYHRAVELAVSAYELARRAADSSRMADAALQISMAHLSLKDYPAALLYAEEAAGFYLRQDDHYYATDALTLHSTVLLRMDRTEQAVAAAERAVALAEEHQLDDLTAQAQQSLGVALLAADRLPAAERTLLTAEVASRGQSGTNHRPVVLESLARLYLRRNQPARALRYGEEGLALARERKQTVQTHQLLGHLAVAAERRGQPVEALRYLQQRQLYQDSLYQEEIGRQLAEFSLRFERVERERELAAQRAELALLQAQRRADRLQKTLLGLGLFLVLLLLVFAVWSFRQRRRRHQLEQQRLGDQLREQQRELSARVLQMTQKTRLLDDLSDELTKVRGERPDDRKKLDRLVRDLNSEERIDQDWENFRTYFQGVHGDYLDRLKALSTAKLSPRELRLSALIRMGLSNAEIAPVLGVTAETLYKAKYRLRKKLPPSEYERVDELLLEV